VPPEALTVETAQALRDGGPWGQGFSEPMFDDHFDVLSQRIVGERHWRLVVRPADSDTVVDAIAFNAVDDFPRVPDRIHAAYRLEDNEWQGRVSVQLRFDHMQEPGP
jgi:single-stranded-DNA-specific exonuclease